MGLVFLPRLRAENLYLREKLDERTAQCLRVLDKCDVVVSELLKYQSLGSYKYLRKLVEADKK